MVSRKVRTRYVTAYLMLPIGSIQMKFDGSPTKEYGFPNMNHANLTICMIKFSSYFENLPNLN
jgi:hypothetical protein